MGLISPLLRALATMHHREPTPIQAAAVPTALAGRDILGCAQTGTGKTASFVLPMLQRLAAAEARPSAAGAGRAGPRALVMAPTRELVLQIAESVAAYGQNLSITHGIVMGGVNANPQVAMLRRGIDILLATPGRLLDHMAQGNVDFRDLEVLVIDEADRMLDMGFIRDIRRILTKLPARRQTMLFSATMPPPIVELSREVLNQPHRVQVAPPATTPDLIEQHARAVASGDKTAYLLELLASEKVEQAIVFTRTKWGANKLLKYLVNAGHVAAALHGNKSQNQRRAALEGFRDGRLRILVATDIAARGLDVAGVSHVINYELPQVAEDYVHRIGRTGRAEAKGIAISLVSPEEGGLLRDIERLLGKVLLPGARAPTGGGGIGHQRSGPRRRPSGRRPDGSGGGGRPQEGDRSSGGYGGGGGYGGARPATSGGYGGARPATSGGYGGGGRSSAGGGAAGGRGGRSRPR